jgi:hypothetical protein
LSAFPTGVIVDVKAKTASGWGFFTDKRTFKSESFSLIICKISHEIEG